MAYKCIPHSTKEAVCLNKRATQTLTQNRMELRGIHHPFLEKITGIVFKRVYKLSNKDLC